ncbi:MAG: pilus motility taxis protein HmpF [Nostocaceae cyanobacterium]|nr:pilus motility taxis protein HmpF [Nostocaceae cyanobacterium]
MLYLAEVQKQKGGLLGGGKAELKLLACQRTDQSWSNVSGDDILPLDDASKLTDGALVMVELNPTNRQIQRIQEAGRQVANFLQNLSRHVEKYKLKEEEIDQWKQSLTFQAQELNRREMDLEVRQEAVQQREEDLERLEAQQQQVESRLEEVGRLREEIDRKTNELEGAWEHLRGEQRRLEESQAAVSTGTLLDEQQSQKIQELLDSLSRGVAPVETVREQLNLAFELLEHQQSILTLHWQQLQQQRMSAQQQQDEINRLTPNFEARQNEWQQAQNSLDEAKAELRVHSSVLGRKQEYAQMLAVQVRNLEELYQQMYRVAETSAYVKITPKVDTEALEKMPLEELQYRVQDLQRDLQKCSSFVNDQEEELKYQQQTIAELQAKLNQASDSQRGNIEAELAEEQDRYQMLNETLVGQRRNLREWEENLYEHQAIMLRRQGQPVNGLDDKKIDLGSILVQIEVQRQQKSEELQHLEREIEQMRASLEQAQRIIDIQSTEQQRHQQELQTVEQNLLLTRITASELWGRVHLYQESLQPIQDCVDGLRQKMDAMASGLIHVQQTGDDQMQTISQMQQTLHNLISSQFTAP